MTVPATTRRAGPFNGNGVTTSFPFTFKVFAAADIEVTRVSTTGIESVLVLNSGYTVTLNPDQDASPGGSITPTTLLATGETLTVIGALPYDQTLDLPGGGAFSPLALENALDRAEMQIQQLAEENSRALTLPVSAGGTDVELPAPQAGRVLGWNDAATGLTNVDPQTLATVVAYGTAKANIFSGDGVTQAFGLTDDPVNLNNLDVAIDGVTQTPTIDYTWSSGTTLTFTTAPPAGTSNILVRYMQGLPQSGSALPNQTGNADKFLNTNGTDPAWVTPDANKINYTGYGGVAVNRAGDKLRRDPYLNDMGVSAVNADNYAAGVAALAAVGIYGTRLGLTTGTYVFGNGGANGAVKLTKPIHIVGEGGLYTAINPSLVTGTAPDALVIDPVVGGPDWTSTCLEGFSLHNPVNGTRTGRHGIFINTVANGQQLPKFTLRDINIGQTADTSGRGIYHLNAMPALALTDPLNINKNGGMFAALFQNLVVKGGIKLETTGDSNSIVHCKLEGTQVGIEASMATGASLLEVQGCNITNSGGTAKLTSSSRFRFIGNNCENVLPGAAADNNGAMVSILDTNGPTYGGVIKENLFGGFGTSDAVRILRMLDCRGTLVQDNVFVSGGVGTNPTIGIDIFSSCRDVRIGPNIFQSTVSLPTKVNDGGVGTMGVVKTTAALNGWLDFATSAATIIDFIKSPGDGIVHLAFSVKSGTTTNGTLICTLPEGFRPERVIRAPAFALDGVTPSACEVTVETDGSVRFNYAKATMTSVNISFPALNLAHGTTAE